MIERPEYLEELKSWKDKDLIKVITGIRRCGKSTLLELFIQELRKQKVKDNHIIFINLESPDYDFQDYKELYQYIKKQIKDKSTYYVLLDEVQNISQFQKAVDGLYILKNVDVKSYSLLSEFAKVAAFSDIFEYKLLEHGNVIIKKNAISTGIRFFVK